MAQEVILAEQTLEFAVDSSYGLYLSGLCETPELTVGETYTVYFDGTAYACEYVLSENGLTYMGNPYYYGLGDDNEIPFICGIITVDDSGVTHYVMFGTPAKDATHTVAIYQEVEAAASIILKDRDGNDVNHGVSGPVRLRMSDGSTKLFVNEDDVAVPEEITVDLSMAEGDQVIEPSAEGKVLSKVTIPKPDTLIPANIAEGVDIAGVIGTLAASSGGSVKIASGSIAGNSGAVTITHDLGVTPDFIYVFNPSATMNTSTRNILRAAGLSATFAKSLGLPYTLTQFGMALFPSGSNIGISGNNNIDTTNADANSFITNANDTSFVLGNSTYIALNPNTYYWMAVGGLT